MNVLARLGSAQGQPGRGPAWFILLAVTWSVLLFGAVYPWTYLPLLIGIALLGAYGWISATPCDREPARPIAAGLLVVMLIVAVQLVPLPAETLEHVSPATDAFLRRYEFSYGLARSTGVPARHPLSIAPDATLRALGFLVVLSLFLLGCTAVIPRIRLGWLMRRLIALGFFVALFGIVQRATFNDRLYWFWVPVNVASNSFGPFVNRNHFAGWMLMTACLTAGYLYAILAEAGPQRPRSWSERAAWLSTRQASHVLFVSVALIVMVLSVVWTLSRSGIAALSAALGVFAWYAAAKLAQRHRTVAAALILSIPIGAVAWRGFDTVLDWYGRTDTLAWRLQLWADTAPIMRDFWLTGTGLNTYGTSTLVYPTTDDAWHAAEAHSDYVQLASEGGVLLITAVASVTFLLIRGIRRAFRFRQSPATYWLRAGATIGLVAIAVQELADFSLQIPANAVLFAWLAAVALHRPPESAKPAQHLGFPGAALSR